MNPVRRLVSKIVPATVREQIRAAYRRLIFARAMKRFRRRLANWPGASAMPLRELIRGWGNESWSAQTSYLATCLDRAWTSTGPILECGSGLSTILVGAIAKHQGRTHWALEHTPEWSAKVQQTLDRYRLDTVVLCAAPLKDYGEFSWYDPPLSSMPADFGLVICDGPPGETKGGRYGLMPILSDRFAPRCIILLDDTVREQERAIARRWQAEGAGAIAVGHVSSTHVELSFKGSPTG